MTKKITKKHKATTASKDRRSILEMAKALARIQKASPGVYDVTFRLVSKGRVEQLSMVRVGEDADDDRDVDAAEAQAAAGSGVRRNRP